MIIFDALRVKIRDEGVVRNKAVYVALGITREGTKEVLGLWIEQTEGAKFWLKVMTELKNRGVQDVLICLVDGLKGFPEAIEAISAGADSDLHRAFAASQSGVLLLARSQGGGGRAQSDLSRSERRGGAQALSAFEAGRWGQRYPPIVASWRRHWERVIPFFAYPQDVRRVLYTTNAIESLNMQLRKVTKSRSLSER